MHASGFSWGRLCEWANAEFDGRAYRRSVKTGASISVYFGKRLSTSSSSRRGIRTVCRSCADEVDLRDKIENCVMSAIGLISLEFSCSHVRDIEFLTQNFECMMYW